MNKYRAAKHLTFSLLAAAALGGCAVYEPGYPAAYQPGPYGYGAPAYAGPPAYVGPPVYLNFGFESRHGFRGGHHGRHFHGR